MHTIESLGDLPPLTAPAVIVAPPTDDVIDFRALMHNPAFAAGVKAELEAIEKHRRELTAIIEAAQAKRRSIDSEDTRLRKLLDVLEPVEIPF